jgi:UDP-GlcNAc:undecaprenyl-phosphate GlcNAc-1-phosphate transferase
MGTNAGFFAVETMVDLMPVGMAALGAVLALGVGVFAGPLGRWLGLMDWPDDDGGRKRHARVTPLVGGLAVTLAALMGAALTGALGDMAAFDAVLGGPAPGRNLGWLATAVGVMFLIGASDDRFHLSPVLRLLAALVVLILVVSSAPDFALAFLHFGGGGRLFLLGSAGVGFTLLCLIGLLNAVNMADGKNGVVIGMGLIWSLVLFVHLPAPYVPVLAAVAGALLVLFGFNMAGRLFLGDGGSYALSALFGLLAVLAYNLGFETWHAGDVALLFAVPVMDTIRLMVVRLGRGQSPFEGDRDHLHHHLHARLGWPRGLMVYLALVAGPNLGALLWPGTGWMWLVLTLGLFVLVLRLTAFAPASQRPAE